MASCIMKDMNYYQLYKALKIQRHGIFIL